MAGRSHNTKRKRYPGAHNISPRLVNIPTAAKYLGVHYNTMCRYLDARLIHPVTMPLARGDRRHRLVDLAELDAFIDQHKGMRI